MEDKNRKVKSIKLNPGKEVWFYSTNGTYTQAQSIESNYVTNCYRFEDEQKQLSIYLAFNNIITGYGISEQEKGSIIVEFEEEKRMKYPNGAVVKLEEGEDYFYIDSLNDIYGTPYGHQYHLQNQNAFLSYEDAKKWRDVKNTHNKLLKKIVKINYENNWVPDWGNKVRAKYFLVWDYLRGQKYHDCNYSERDFHIYMSEQAKDYMMSDKVSDEDFKKFLFILD
jgi:hypothetical protein